MILKKKVLENIAEKGENTGREGHNEPLHMN